MIKDKLTKYAEQIVVFLAMSLFAAIALLVYDYVLLPLAEKNQGKILIQITTSILGLLLVAISIIAYLYIVKLRPRSRLKKEYIFNDRIGIYTHKLTGQHYCGTCMLENVESPLITLDHGWFCQRKGCSKSYSDPENPRPAPKREVISRGVDSWVHGWKR